MATGKEVEAFKDGKGEQAVTRLRDGQFILRYIALGYVLHCM